MAQGSEQVSFRKYGVKPVCCGCGRKLVKKNERAMWFASDPPRVFGLCCWNKAAKI